MWTGNSSVLSGWSYRGPQRQPNIPIVGEHGGELCDDDHRDVPLQSTEQDALPLRCLG